MATLGVSVLVLLCILVSATAYRYRSSNRRVITTNEWQFLDQWNFDTGNVRFNYNITFPKNYSPMKLLFYQPEQFMMANDSSKSCDDKLGELQNFNAVPNQIINLEETMTSSGCMQRYDRDMGAESVYCQGRVQFRVDRGRMWYVVASRCGNMNFITGMKFRYWIDNDGERDGREGRDKWRPDYPRVSGQSEVTFSTLTLATLYILTRCLA